MLFLKRLLHHAVHNLLLSPEKQRHRKTSRTLLEDWDEFVDQSSAFVIFDVAVFVVVVKVLSPPLHSIVDTIPGRSSNLSVAELLYKLLLPLRSHSSIYSTPLHSSTPRSTFLSTKKMQSVKIVALVAFLCALSFHEADAQYYAAGYWPYASYAPWSYLNPYGRYYAWAGAPVVIGKRSAGFGPSEQAPMMEPQPQ
uniref:Uncharacterized protein n=1 Tax=Plectus sambesii TaxID=2011161 RepID=A0A914USB8_9BILA